MSFTIEVQCELSLCKRCGCMVIKSTGHEPSMAYCINGHAYRYSNDYNDIGRIQARLDDVEELNARIGLSNAALRGTITRMKKAAK